MNKLLLHFDTDNVASSFDAVVAYDAGIDHLIQYAGVNCDNCTPLVEGAVYTRAPTNKKYTAIFVSGSDIVAGQNLFDAVKDNFFSNFRVSTMFDSNGCNTTAAAAVALLESHITIKDKIITVLAGTGPVGQRISMMLLQRGAKSVYLSSRTQERASQACDEIEKRFSQRPIPMKFGGDEKTTSIMNKTQIIIATGKTGIQLLEKSQWHNLPQLEALVDVNTKPPTGIEGIKINDNGTHYNSVLAFGGLAIGAVKLRLQRACIAELFNDNEKILDAKEILAVTEKIVV